MNNEFETKRSWPDQGTAFEFVWRDLGKQRETSVRISGAPTEHLPNTRVERYLFTNLLGTLDCRL
jgi:hypothetical protein